MESTTCVSEDDTLTVPRNEAHFLLRTLDTIAPNYVKNRATVSAYLLTMTLDVRLSEAEELVNTYIATKPVQDQLYEGTDFAIG